MKKKLKITLRKWNQEEHTKFVLQAKLSSNLHKKRRKKKLKGLFHINETLFKLQIC